MKQMKNRNNRGGEWISERKQEWQKVKIKARNKNKTNKN